MTTEEIQSEAELRVPTATLRAEVLCSDGETLLGRLFVPVHVSVIPGPMRPDERLNDEAEFFPFKPEDGGKPVILNKARVVVASFALDQFDAEPEPASSEFSGETPEFHAPEQRVCIEVAGKRLEGMLEMDTPEYQQRILDYLNRPERFMSLRDADRIYFINRDHIVRATELGGG